MQRRNKFLWDLFLSNLDKPIQINSRKKMRENERGVKTVAYVYQQTNNYKSKSIKYVAFKERNRNIKSSMNTTYYET